MNAVPLLPTHAQSQRRRNRGAVLQALLGEVTASRADLARLTGLSRPTISEVVGDLITDGVILETGQSTGTRPGKPAVMLEVDGESLQTIAVDLSEPDWIVGAVCGPDGRVLVRRETARSGGDDLPGATSALVAELARVAGTTPLGVGIGVPMGMTTGDLSALEGAVRAQPSVVSLPVHVVADAELAARAEARVAPTDQEFLLVRLGDGISTAIVTGYLGDSGARTARELAHVDVGGDAGRACRCGQRGCVHAWTAEFGARIAGASDETSRAALRVQAGAALGKPLAAIVSALDLPHVVLSGSSDLIDEGFCSAAETALAAARLTHAHVEVRRSEAEDAVLRGAVAQVLAAELI